MPYDKWVESRDLVAEINFNLMKLSELIEEAESEKEANLIEKEVRTIVPAGDTIAHDMWEWMVDWKNVRWKEKEKEVV